MSETAASEQAGNPGATDETKTDGSLALTIEEAEAALGEGGGKPADETQDGKTAKPAKDGEGKTEKVEFSPEQQAILEARIGKEVAKRKELEEKLETLTQRLDRERAERTERDPEAMPANLAGMNEDQLLNLEERLEKMLEWCDEHPDGQEADPNDARVKAYTADEVRRARTMYGAMLRKIPRAREGARDRAEVEATLPERFPELADARSEQSRQYAWFAKVAGPQFAALPNAKVLYAHMLLGEQVERARLQARAAKAGGERRSQEEPPKLPIGKGGKGTRVVEEQPKGKKALNLKRLVDSGGSLETAVEVLMEAET
jgi:hypothetical protein